MGGEGIDFAKGKRSAVDFDGFPEKREGEDEANEDGKRESEALESGFGFSDGFGVQI